MGVEDDKGGSVSIMTLDGPAWDILPAGRMDSGYELAPINFDKAAGSENGAIVERNPENGDVTIVGDYGGRFFYAVLTPGVVYTTEDTKVKVVYQRVDQKIVY